jgi:hypothetical protein
MLTNCGRKSSENTPPGRPRYRRESSIKINHTEIQLKFVK